MFRSMLNGRWTAGSGLIVLSDAPGEGAGGGAAAPAAPAVDDGGAPGDGAGAEGAAADDGGAAGGGGADELDDPDDDTYVEPDASALPEPNVRTHLRRTQRYNSKARPIAELFRDPNTGRLMSADQVRGIAERGRDFDAIDRLLKLSPRAVQVLREEEERLAAGGGSGAAADDDTPFDEASWPFEKDSAEGKVMLQMAKDLHDSKKTIKRLTGTVEGVQKGTQSQREAEAEERWKTETLTAAKEVDQAYAPMFVRGVYRQFQLLKAQGLLTSRNAKAVIEAELKELRAHNKAKGRTAGARASAMAAGNTTLPRTPKPGAAQPASAAAKPTRETIKDASKGFLAKYR